MTRGGGKKKKGRMVQPGGNDQVSQARKREQESQSQVDSQWDTTNHDDSWMDASMISYMDSSTINERESESLTDALNSTKLTQSTKTGEPKNGMSAIFKIEATLDDEIVSKSARSERQQPSRESAKQQMNLTKTVKEELNIEVKPDEQTKVHQNILVQAQKQETPTFCSPRPILAGLAKEVEELDQ